MKKIYVFILLVLTLNTYSQGPLLGNYTNGFPYVYKEQGYVDYNQPTPKHTQGSKIELDLPDPYFTTYLQDTIVFEQEYENGYLLCMDERDTIPGVAIQITVKGKIKVLDVLKVIQYYHYCEINLPNQLYKEIGYFVLIPRKVLNKPAKGIWVTSDLVFY